MSQSKTSECVNCYSRKPELMCARDKHRLCNVCGFGSNPLCLGCLREAEELVAKPIPKSHRFRPKASTLRGMIEYLERIGLRVYGPNVNLETGERDTALRDYSPKEVLQYRVLMEKTNANRS